MGNSRVNAHSDFFDRAKSLDNGHSEISEKAKSPDNGHYGFSDRAKSRDKGHSEFSDRAKSPDNGHSEISDKAASPDNAHSGFSNRAKSPDKGYFGSFSYLYPLKNLTSELIYRNAFILLIALLAMAFGLQAQQLAVKSFRSLPHDMDALQNYPLKDQNGEVCAIVKVQTLEEWFYFDIGTLGIMKTEQKSGEIWVYMPHGAKRLTITHKHFLPLRDYFFTEPIVEGACYELVLASGRSVTTIIPDEIETQWLIITSDPAGADVFIDDQPAKYGRPLICRRIYELIAC